MGLDKIMLIDGNSILNRAFYGLQGEQLLATSDGLYTNAVFGFINIMMKYIEEEKPQYICVAFDMKTPTFRHKEFDGYKAKRKGMPPELAVQVPVIKDILDAMNIKRLEIEGYEADDIIGTLSLKAKNHGMETVIVTGDKDSLQLIDSMTRVKLPVTRGGRTETEEYDTLKMVEKYGIGPEQFVDVKGLMGDTSDNIPGVPGIGEKTALDLIKAFSSIENIYENIDSIDKKSVKEKLINGRELAFLSKGLSAIHRDVPFDWEPEELKMKGFNNDKLYQLFKRLEFKSFIDKFGLAKRAAKAENIRIEVIDSVEELEKIKDSINAAGKLSIICLMDRLDSFTLALSGVAVTYENGKSSYIPIGGKIDENTFYTVFKDIFEDEGIKKYGHNLKGLITHLRFKGIAFRGLAYDTMIAAYLINPSRETYTVAELAEEYLGLSIDSLEEMQGKGKGHTDFRDMLPGNVSRAACGYASAVYDIWEKLDSELKANGQAELYEKIELPLVEVLADMEYQGFKVDVQGLKAFSIELDQKINSLVTEIFELAGESFNINSTRQLGVILFEKLGLPVLKKTKTGYSTDAEVLEQLAEKHEIVGKILEYRQLVKLKSTYIEGMLAVINPHTGKIHSSFNQTVTVTGRISSTEPNLQNIPIKLEMGRKIRKVFVPTSSEFQLIDADYSQIELRVLAHITGDANMIEAFAKGEDIHTSTAVQIFNVSKSEITPLMRSRAKAVNFSIIYGIGDFSLSKDLGITRKEARRYIDQYLDRYPGVRKYMHDIVEKGNTEGYVTTMFNRRRYLPELKSSNFNIRSFGERIAMNTPIQGSAADIIKIAMVNVYRELEKRKLKSRLILQVHDELIVEAYLEEKEEVMELLREGMENAVHMKVPLKVDVKSGGSWYETK